MPETDNDLLYAEEAYAIVGAAIEVWKELGAGFLEPVYQEALELELRDRNIPFSAQVELAIRYKTHTLEKSYIADIVAYQKIIIELKALSSLSSREEAQIINYLKASGHRLGLIFNFGASGRLEWKRFIR
jgi:GxxExxY protein